METIECVVVGAGVAGLAAAGRQGAGCVVFDEQPGPRTALKEAARQAAEAGAELRFGHTVWGIFGGQVVGVFDGTRTWLVRAERLILAPGAIDLDLAFPGVELEGVVGGLELLRDVDAFRGRRLVVLGETAVAEEVRGRAADAGIQIVGSAVGPCTARAEGPERVERVYLNDDVVEADGVCVAIGRQPSIELATLAGCRLGFDVRRGGHYALSTGATWIAGDAAGASDAASGDPTAAERSDEHAAHFPGQDPNVDELSGKGASASGWYASEWHRLVEATAGPETVVCPCEGTTRAQLTEAIALAQGSPDDVKRLSRAGMGSCQARRCRASVGSLIARHLGCAYAEVPLTTFRPPVRLVPLAALATEAEVPEPACFAPFAAAEARLAEAARAGELAPLALMRFRRAALVAAYACERDGTDPQRTARDLEEDVRFSERRHS